MHKLLDDLCEIVTDNLEDVKESVKKGGGRLSSGQVDHIDKLTHALKSIKTTLKMAEEDEGSSGRSYRSYGSYGSYDGGSGEGGGSGRRGRDSMGRYTSRDMSGDGDFMSALERAADRAPDERTREDIERMMSSRRR